MKPMFKPPGTKRLKLFSDEPPSNFAFRIHVRLYNEEKPPKSVCLQDLSRVREEAGAYTRPLLSSTLAVLPSEPFFVQFVTSYDPSIY